MSESRCLIDNVMRRLRGKNANVSLLNNNNNYHIQGVFKKIGLLLKLSRSGKVTSGK